MLSKKNVLLNAKLILFSTMLSIQATNAYAKENDPEEKVTVISMESADSGPGFEVSESDSNAKNEKEEVVEPVKEEEILNSVLGYMGTSYENYISFANYIIMESSKNQISYQNYEEITSIFSEIAQIPAQEKLLAVLQKNGLTLEEFEITASIVNAEAVNYIDAFCVAESMQSRATSSGTTAFIQATIPGQYIVYPKLSRKYLYTHSYGYHALLDNLYAEIYCKEKGLPLLKAPRWMSFRSNRSNPNGKIQVVPGGNRFYNEMNPMMNLNYYEPTVSPSEYSEGQKLARR